MQINERLQAVRLREPRSIIGGMHGEERLLSGIQVFQIEVRESGQGLPLSELFPNRGDYGVLRSSSHEGSHLVRRLREITTLQINERLQAVRLREPRSIIGGMLVEPRLREVRIKADQRFRQPRRLLPIVLAEVQPDQW